MKTILDGYIQKTKKLKNSLGPIENTEEIFPKVRELVLDMQSALEDTNDEILYPVLYNASATIASAPQGCSARQLTEALDDAISEMEIMKEYL